MLLHSPFPRPSSAFVGRRDELRRVEALLPREVLFLIYGIAGIGKSEFIYKAMEEARASPGFRTATPLLLLARPGQRAEHLLSLLRLSLRPPAARGSKRPATGRSAGFDEELAAVAQLLEARPFLLFIDDVHHLDAAAASMLAYLARRVGRSRIFAASRTELVLPPGTPPPVLIRLQPLDAATSATLVTALAERFGIDGADPAALFARSGGSPFLIQHELGRLHCLPTATEGPADPTLSTLSPEARRLLLLARVLPGRLTVESLAAEGVGEATVAELGRRFLIDLERGTLVVHDLIWDALRPLLPEGELRLARVSAALYLRRRFDVDPQHGAADGIEALRQLLLCGPTEREPALALLLHAYSAIAAAGLDHLLLPLLASLLLPSPSVAGPGLEQRFAIELLRARIYLRRSDIAQAETILLELGRQPEASRSLRYLRLAGEVEQRSGRLAAARQRFEQALAVAETTRERFQVTLQLGHVASLSGAGSARALLEQARSELGSLTAVDGARWGWSRSLGYLVEERLSAAAELAAQTAATLVRSVGDSGAEDLLALLAMHEIIARAESHEVGQARLLLDRILHQAAGSGALREPSTLLYRGIVRAAAGELPAARESLQAALQALTAQQDFAPAAVAAHYLGRTLLGLGDLDGALHASQRALRLSRATGIVSLVARAEVLSAQQLLASAQLPTLRAQLEPLLGRLDWPLRSRASAQLLLAKCAALLGDSPAAWSAVSEALLLSRDIDAGDGWSCELDVELGELVALGGLGAPPPSTAGASLLTTSSLIERCERAWHHFATRGCRYLEVRAALALAALLLSSGGSDSRARVAEALERAQELSSHGAYALLHLRTQLLEAALQRRSGEERQAMATLRRALRSSSEPSLEQQLLEVALALAGGSSGVASGRLRGRRDKPPALPRAAACLARLGLGGDSRFEVIDRSGCRDADESECQRLLAERSLVIDLERGLISRRGGEAISGRPLMTALLLALLATAAEGVSAERLFYDVWGGREWNPLRHRNTIHVAITRLRQLLRDLLPGREVVETSPNGWRLCHDLDICAIRKKPLDERSASLC